MKGQTNHQILEGNLPRRLRNAPTDGEQKLWQRLKGRQIERCKFRRQHPYANYILDFVCLERHLVVELDGRQHMELVARDAARTRFLEMAGFLVLRFWNNEVLSETDAVLEVIQRELIARANPSPPNPPLEGQG